MARGRMRIGFATGARLPANQGVVSVAGQATTVLRRGKTVQSAPGAYAITGKPAAFKRKYVLPVVAGAMSLVGKAASLVKSGGVTMNQLGLMGGNMNSSIDHANNPVFANAIEQARGFSLQGTNYNVCAVDANGWPTGPSYLTLSANSYVEGGNIIPGQSYAMSWFGAQSAFPASGSGFTITNKTGPDGNGKCTATFNATTLTTIAFNIASAIQFPRIMRPGLPEDFASRWAPSGVAYYKQFSGLRFMKNGGGEWMFVPPGTYDLSWTGGGTLTVNAAYQGSISNGGASPCQVTVITGEDFLLATAQTIPANTVVTVSRAGFPAGTFKIFQNQLTGLKANYLVLCQDSMDWADRWGRTHFSSNNRETLGISIDDQVAFSNELYAASGSNYKFAWICINHVASDDYIANAAAFIRDNLNPNLNVIVEYSNETWNIVTYRSYFWQYWKAIEEVALGGSNLNYDGSVDALTWRRRFHARRTRDIAMAFQSAFGASFGTRCQIALCDQLGGGGPNEVNMLRFLKDNYPGIPGDYIHAAGASYYSFISANAMKIAADGPAVVAHWETDPAEGRPNLTANASLWVEDAAIFGVRRAVAYEGGPWCFYAIGNATTLRQVSFIAGAVAPTIGTSITQGANSALVQSIELDSGSWAGGNAVGRFITGSVTPGPFTAGVLTGGAVATLSGADVVALLNANDVLKVANAMNSPEVEQHIQNVIQDFVNVGGREFNFFNVAGGPAFTELTNANAMGHGTVVVGNTFLPPSHKSQGALDMLTYVVPPSAALSVRNAIPGTINPCATVNSVLVQYYRTNDLVNAVNNYPTYFTSGWAPALDSVNWEDFAIFVRATATYTVTPRVQSRFNAIFRVLIDDVERFNSGIMTTGIYPGTAPTIAQTPFTVALTEGWHRMRFEATCKTTGNQHAFGPITFA